MLSGSVHGHRIATTRFQREQRERRHGPQRGNASVCNIEQQADAAPFCPGTSLEHPDGHPPTIRVLHGTGDAGLLWITGAGHTIHRGPLWDGPITGLTDAEATEQAYAWHCEETRELVALRSALIAGLPERPDAAERDNTVIPCSHSEECGGDTTNLKHDVACLSAAWTATHVEHRWETARIGDMEISHLYRGADPEPLGEFRYEKAAGCRWLYDNCRNYVGSVVSEDEAAALIREVGAPDDLREAQRLHRLIQRYDTDCTLVDCLSSVARVGYYAATTEAQTAARRHAAAGPPTTVPGPGGRWVHVYEPGEGHIGLLRRGPDGDWTMCLAGLESAAPPARDGVAAAADALRTWNRSVARDIAEACADAAAFLQGADPARLPPAVVSLRPEPSWERQATSGCAYDPTHACDDWVSYGERHRWQDSASEWSYLLGQVTQTLDPPRFDRHSNPADGHTINDVYRSGVGNLLGRIDVGPTGWATVTSPHGARRHQRLDSDDDPYTPATAVAFLYKEAAAVTVRRALLQRHEHALEPASEPRLSAVAYAVDGLDAPPAAAEYLSAAPSLS